MSLRPAMDVSVASTLIKKLYHMEAMRVQEFVSYDDRNFFFETTEDNSMVKAYVLKVSNWQDSLSIDFFSAQNELMKSLWTQGFNVPTPLLNVQDKDLSLENLDHFRKELDEKQVNKDETQMNVVRVLTFVPGCTLASQCSSSSPTASTLMSVGRLLANLSLSMQELLSPDQEESVAKRFSPWFLKNCVQVCRPLVSCIKDVEDRELMCEVLDLFETEINLDNLPTGIIHGDLNEMNVIIMEEKETLGVIDFGDVNVAPLIFDLAATTAYMLLVVHPDAEALHKVGNVIKAYSKIRALTEDEWSALPICVAARFVQSLVLGADAFNKDPSNEYVLASAKNGFEVLRKIHKFGYKQLKQLWFQRAKEQ